MSDFARVMIGGAEREDDPEIERLWIGYTLEL
jgi:hypothetical protein